MQPVCRELFVSPRSKSVHCLQKYTLHKYIGQILLYISSVVFSVSG